MQFWVIKIMDWIRIGIQPKMLDPDPYQMNTDPKHCQIVTIFLRHEHIPEKMSMTRILPYVTIG